MASIRQAVPSGVLVIILFALEQLYQIPGQRASGYFACAASLLPIRFVLEIWRTFVTPLYERSLFCSYCSRVHACVTMSANPHTYSFVLESVQNCARNDVRKPAFFYDFSLFALCSFGNFSRFPHASTSFSPLRIT